MSNTLDLSAAAGTPIKLSSLIIHLRPGLFLYQKCQINPRMSFLWLGKPRHLKSHLIVSLRLNGRLTTHLSGENRASHWRGSFEAGAILDADPTSHNQVTFDTADNTPTFSNLSTAGQAGKLTIIEGGSMPNNVYSTGIGMSGQGTFAQQVLANTTQLYTPEPLYFIAAGQGSRWGRCWHKRWRTVMSWNTRVIYIH